jgi:peptidoglycan hydrolase-like protein with peptidoglycan-binding domain
MKTRHIVLLSSLLWLWPLIIVMGEPSRPDTQSPVQEKLLTSGDILMVQQRLAEFRFNPGPIDGVWHPNTTTALRSFQGQYGLTVTGELDPETRRALKVPPSSGAGGTDGR